MNKEKAIKEIKKEFEDKLKNVRFALCPSNPDQRMNHYLNSYCSLLKVSQSLSKQAIGNPNFRYDAIVAIAHMAFGWMPATLKMCDINDEKEHNGKNKILDAFDVNTLDDAKCFVKSFASSPMNNSCIGFSKSLHFINPEIFPIWDSNVAETFEMDRYYQIKKIPVYGCYIDFCHSVLVDCQTVAEAVKEVQDLFCCHAKYKVEKIRALEFILFVRGKRIKEMRSN